MAVNWKTLFRQNASDAVLNSARRMDELRKAWKDAEHAPEMARLRAHFGRKRHKRGGV